MSGQSYCALSGEKRRVCRVTDDPTKDSSECTYDQEKNKCFVLKGKAASRAKTAKTVAAARSVAAKQIPTLPPIRCDYRTNVSLDTLRKYRQVANDRSTAHIKYTGNIEEFHEKVMNEEYPKAPVGGFWLDDWVKVPVQQPVAAVAPVPVLAPVPVPLAPVPAPQPPKSNNQPVPPQTRVPKTKLPSKKGNKTIAKAQVELNPLNSSDYVVINVPPDGNCGYHSFLKAMELNQYPTIVNKKERKTPDDLRDLIKRKLARSTIQSELAAKARAAGGIGVPGDIPDEFWMENEEMAILASAFDVCIHVWDSRMQLWTFLPAKPNHDRDKCLLKRKNIYIYADGVHYQVIQRRV